MFNAVFASISKRSNSTLIPTLTGGTTISIELLDETSIISPSIRLYYAGNPTSFNYCYIAEFGRYYFINEWISDHNQWIASMSIDVLASWKTQILAHSEYVLRSSSEFSGRVIDMTYPALVGQNERKLNPLSIWQSSYDPTSQTVYYPLKENESFVVGIYGMLDVNDFGDQTAWADYVIKNTRGSITYYWLSLAELVKLIIYLNSNNMLTKYNITDISNGGQKALINPLQYIASIIALPISREIYTGARTTQKMQYGWFDLNVSEVMLGTQVVSLFDVSQWYTKDYDSTSLYNHPTNVYIDFRGIQSDYDGYIHPAAYERGVYLAYPPYTTCHCVFDPFGEFDIDLTKCNMDTLEGIYLKTEIEGIQGIGILTAYPVTTSGVDYTHILARREAQVGIEVAVNQLAVNNLQFTADAFSSIAGMVGSAMSGNIGGVIANAASGITNALQYEYPNNQTKGINGTNIHRFSDLPIVTILNTLQVAEDNAQLGRPLCQVRTLNTLSGFCMTRDADVYILGCTEAETEKIKSYLNNGFFIE